MHLDDTKKLYNEAYDHKMSYAHKNKQIHIPRYWVVVIWGLFMTFVVYVYALQSLNDLQQSNYLIDSMRINQKVKIKATMEFLPNEPEPQFVQMPAL